MSEGLLAHRSKARPNNPRQRLRLWRARSVPLGQFKGVICAGFARARVGCPGARSWTLRPELGAWSQNGSSFTKHKPQFNKRAAVRW